MKFQQAIPSRSRWKEIRNFIIHLRWHYQVGILSGGFLLGGFLSATMNWQEFLIQFANVHLLLFGGATAFNSYWDKDQGPVGGLKHPPPMSRWMWPASLLLQIAGLWLAVRGGMLFVFVYIVSMILFWLYSTPLFRWKGSPWKSLVAIGISTGANSVLFGYLAAGNISLNAYIIFAALGVMLIILSFYPASQLYQTEEDAQRGDRTFGVTYGKEGIILFFVVTFSVGIVTTAVPLSAYDFWIGIVFLVIGGLAGIAVWHVLKTLNTTEADYHKVMRIKYGTSLAFVGFLVLMLLMKHLHTT